MISFHKIKIFWNRRVGVIYYKEQAMKQYYIIFILVKIFVYHIWKTLLDIHEENTYV